MTVETVDIENIKEPKDVEQAPEDDNEAPRYPKPELSAEEAARQRKLDHWKNSPFAVGCVNPTWKDDSPFADKGVEKDFKMSWSATCCGCLGADRIGNMAVCCKGMEEYGEDGRKRPFYRCFFGPYWPVNFGLTWPLILGISGFTYWRSVQHQHIAVIISYSIMIFLMCFSLAMVAFSNPGILYRHSEEPEGETDWNWNDQARTYRPPKARFDRECAVVVEDFDHT